MKELTIFEFQAKEIENTLRLIANHFHSQNKKTCLDRDIMQCWEMIKNVIAEQPNKIAPRF